VDLGVGEVSKFYDSMEIVGRKGMITVSKLTKRISFICFKLFDCLFCFSSVHRECSLRSTQERSTGSKVEGG
jgi:hypothetical protein